MTILSWFRVFTAKLQGLLRGRTPEEESGEIETHLSLLTERYVRQGMSPDEAAAVARRQFGNITSLRERQRDMQIVPEFDSMWRDMQYGVRQLRRAPVFTTMAVMSLALGIGANTAIFQLIDAVRLRMLPVKAPHELAEVRMENTRGVTGGVTSASYPTVTNRIWEQIRERQQAFSGIFAWYMQDVNLAPGGEVRNVRMLYAGGDIFSTLGVQPAMGRLFTLQEDQRGCGAPGLVIGHGFWQREYGGSADVIGRTLTLSNHSFNIIGVTSANFFGMEVGRSFDLALPVCAIPLVRGNKIALDGPMWWFTVIGRLKPGWTLEQATAHTRAISPGVFEAALPADYPAARVKDFLGSKLNAIPAGSGVSQLRERYEQALWLLLAIAAMVLIIACANLASLLLARASSREREIAVRQSLGASRGRLVRQLLTENLLLALAGAALGVWLARTLSRLLVAYLSTGADPVFLDLALDWRVVGFAAGVALLTCLLFGLAPAIRATRTEPSAVMKAGGRGMTAGRERFPWRRALMAAQVALSLVLVTSALLFSRSLGNLMTLDPGFRSEGVLTARVVFQRLNLPPERYQPFKEELLARIRGIQGVQAVAMTQAIPLRDFEGGTTVWMDGEEGQGQRASLSRVGPGYFQTLEIRLLAGREFQARDRAGAPNVAIVNEDFARRFLAGANPVGRRFRIGAMAGSPETAYEIVGLVRDTKHANLREEFTPIAYTTPAQDPNWGPGGQILIRSRLPESGIVAQVRRVLNEINPAITVRFQSFQSIVESTIMRERLMATLSGFFGLLALLLACIGLYGILFYSVASRTNEIGIRMALGAERRSVFWMILREALLSTAAGVAVGLPMIFAVTRLASTLLFGLSPTDPVSLGFAVLLMLAVALVGGYLPSRWATRVDPMVALRFE